MSSSLQDPIVSIRTTVQNMINSWLRNRLVVHTTSVYPDNVPRLYNQKYFRIQDLVVSTSDDHAGDFSILFNAIKSKCISYLCRKHAQLAEVFQQQRVPYSNDTVIDIVSSWSHLGHIINSELFDAEDIQNRRGSLIGQTNSLLCYFGKLDSRTKCNLQAYQAYYYDMYGCELWSVS